MFRQIDQCRSCVELTSEGHCDTSESSAFRAFIILCYGNNATWLVPAVSCIHVHSFWRHGKYRTFRQTQKSWCIWLKLAKSSRVTSYMVYPLVNQEHEGTFWNDQEDSQERTSWRYWSQTNQTNREWRSESTSHLPLVPRAFEQQNQGTKSKTNERRRQFRLELLT